MSNAAQRIFNSMMLFALLLSVSLSAAANSQDSHSQQLIPTANYIACDIPDQANLDVDLDAIVDVSILQVIQPFPLVIPSSYVVFHVGQPYSHAFQRAPPISLV